MNSTTRALLIAALTSATLSGCFLDPCSGNDDESYLYLGAGYNLEGQPFRRALSTPPWDSTMELQRGTELALTANYAHHDPDPDEDAYALYRVIVGGDLRRVPMTLDACRLGVPDDPDGYFCPIEDNGLTGGCGSNVAYWYPSEPLDPTGEYLVAFFPDYWRTSEVSPTGTFYDIEDRRAYTFSVVFMPADDAPM